MRALREAFCANFSAGLEAGAAVCVFQRGVEVADFFGGFADAAGEREWRRNTPVLVWSATKAPASACLLHALQERGAGPDLRVADVWPEFAGAGKDRVTVRQVMSHCAGLCALDGPVPEMMDREAVVGAIEAQRPLVPVGEGPAYSPRVFGFFLDEMVRRLSGGEPLGDYWRRVFAGPMGLDFWIGVPDEEQSRIADVIAPNAPAGGEEDKGFLRAFADARSLARRAFSSPKGLGAISAMNQAEVRGACLPAMGGIGTARALAEFHAMLAAGGEWGGRVFFKPETMAWITRRCVDGFDLVLRRPMAFSCGFSLDPLDGEGRKLRESFGPAVGAFGHAGAGGSVAFADPENGISFAYVMNRMEAGVLPGARCRALVDAVYGELGRAQRPAGSPAS